VPVVVPVLLVVVDGLPECTVAGSSLDTVPVVVPVLFVVVDGLPVLGRVHP